MSLETKKRWIGVFISHHKSKISPSSFGCSYLMSWHSSSQNVLHCMMSDCSANYSSICSHSCPFNPKLPQQHHESPISKACCVRIERLLSVSFESQSGIKAPSQHYIIEMILKATCPLWLGFLGAFPHYLQWNKTCCCTPRRIDALLAAWAKQCWAADGFRSSATVSAFSEQLFNTGSLSEESDGQSVLLPMDDTWASKFVRPLWRHRDDVAHCKIGCNSSARVKKRWPLCPGVYMVWLLSLSFSFCLAVL